MYEIHLEEGEVINYNKQVRIEVEGRVHQVGLVLTNFHLMIFEDVNEKIDFKAILHFAKGAHGLPSYELILKEKHANLKYTYEDDNTIIETKEKESSS